METTTNHILEVPTLKLHNGVDLPAISLGTAHAILSEKDDPNIHKNFTGMVPERAYRQVQLALQNGIQAFETARIYRTQRHIGFVLGEWFRQGLLTRSDVFLTTKVYHGDARPVATNSSHMHNMNELSCEEVTIQVSKEVEEALQDLGVGYVDLMLLHWPGSGGVGKSLDGDDNNTNTESDTASSGTTTPRQRRFAAWKVLEEYYARGWLRAIGVSNFSEHHLAQLQEDGATIMPMVNQIEASLAVQYPDILNYCKSKNIVCQAFSPFKRGDLSHEASSKQQILDDIMQKHNKSSAQIALKYLIQKGYAVIYLSTNEGRMKSNHNIFDFTLSENEMLELDKLPKLDGNWGLPTPYDID